MLDLPIHARVRHDTPIDADVVFIIESEELFPSELCAVARDNGVLDSKAMDDVKEEQHGLFGLDHKDRPSLYPLCKLVYSDKQVCIALGALLRGPTISSPQTANSHMMGIVWSAWTSRWVCRA